MAQKPYVVIDSEILGSSIWLEAPHVKLVWLTMLILCDIEGYVGAAVPGIARAAGVTTEQAHEALSILQAPDPESRTKTNEGRRVEVANRGFKILNFLDQIDRLSAERKKTRDRVRRFRERQRAKISGEVTVTPGNHGNVTVAQGIGNRDIGNRELTTDTPPQPAVGVGVSKGEGVAPANPLVAGRRDKLERELQTLVAREAELTDRDPIEVMSEVTHYKGASMTKLNPATMGDDRLANSVLDARARVKELEARKAKVAR